MREKILNDLKDAMKSQNKDLLSTIRSIKAAISLEEINVKRQLNDEEITGLVVKQVKILKESIEEFKKGNRDDLLVKAEQEIKILQSYLPEQITKDAALEIINEAFETIKPNSQSDMGKIMGLVTPKLKGRFDMKEASQIIKEKINNL